MYKAFGLNIESEIDLPQLLTSDHLIPDLKIQWGTVDHSGLTTPENEGLFYQTALGKFWLHVPNVAWFYASNGTNIIIMPDVNSDEQVIRLHLLGSCLGAVLQQRNQLILHGNAIRFGQQCVIFIGKSGSGKSTISAAFQKHGHEILSDDLCVIDKHNHVLPGYPQIKIWHDTAKSLGINTNALQRIRPEVKKYTLTVFDSFCPYTLPIAAIYVLSSNRLNEFQIKPLEGMFKFKMLKIYTYRNHYIDGLEPQKHHLYHCSRVVEQVPVMSLSRPDQGFQIEKLLQLIQSDLQNKCITI